MAGWRTQVSSQVGVTNPYSGVCGSARLLWKEQVWSSWPNIPAHALPSVSELPEPKYHRALGGPRATFIYCGLTAARASLIGERKREDRKSSRARPDEAKSAAL